MSHKTLPKPQILLQSFPQNVDARIYAFGKFQSTKGAPPKLATACATGKVNDEIVGFAIPSHAALCLHAANQAHIRAKSVPLSSFVERSNKALYIRSDCIGYLYTFFDQMFLNVVFAHTALEAFSNQTIPDGYTFTQLRQDKKCTESYNKEQIERSISLDRKLTEILPDVTGIELSKGGRLWNDYVKLRDVRNRIIHVKAVDLGIKELGVRSIWATLLDEAKTDFSIIAHNVIKHFPIKHDPSSSPVATGRDRWITTFPFNRQKPARSQKAEGQKTKDRS